MTVMKSSKHDAIRRERAGSALVLVLLVITGLLVMVAAVGRISLSRKVEVTADIDDRRAFYLAEAGLSEAIASMRRKSSGGVGTQALPAFLGDGIFWTEATDVGGGQTQIDVYALCGSGRAALEAVVEKSNQEAIFDAAISSRTQLTLNADVLVDSFDSTVGTYASQAVTPSGGLNYALSNGNVYRDAAIVLNTQAQVFGDATPGSANAVSFSGPGATVHGSTTPAQGPLTFPPIQVPNLPSGTSMAIPNGGSSSLLSGSHSFSTLDIGQDAHLTIQGPATLVVGSFVGGQDAFLEIDSTNGPVTIYVTQSYTHTSGFQAIPVTGTELALGFLLNSTQPVTFPPNSQVRGAYYAPNADVTFSSTSEAWGSFVANSVTMAPGTRFHYDESLAQHWTVDDGTTKDTMNLLYWRKRDFQPRALLRDRRDPFVALGLNRNALPRPAQAWIY